MSSSLRSFDAVLSEFRALGPVERFREGGEGNADTAAAYSFAPVASGTVPISSLYRQKNPLVYSAQVLGDPKSFARYCAGFESIGTWNARGPGWWVAGEGWIMLEADLTQEQADPDVEAPGDHVSVLLALWTLQDGYAAAVLRPVHRELLAKLMGLESSPKDWQPCTVWIGE